MASNIVFNYERNVVGSMDSFLKIAKWSFLKPQEKIQRKIMDMCSEFSKTFSFHFLGYNNFFVEQVQCQVFEMITKFNFHWQPCAFLFVEYNGKSS